MKRVLVACGNGVATSTVVASKIRDYAEDKDINLKTDQCKLMEVPGQEANYDLVVTTGEFGGKLDTPIVNGMPLLTGMGQDETLEKIVNYLK